MLLARAFDTKISSLYKAGKITGGVYLGRGHEAIAACGGVFLTAGYDVIAPFIREQAARVTWGEPIIEAARAYLGSALGYMKGPVPGVPPQGRRTVMLAGMPVR